MDLAETLSLVVPPGEFAEDVPLTTWVQQRLLPLRKMEELQQREHVNGYLATDSRSDAIRDHETGDRSIPSWRQSETGHPRDRSGLLASVPT